MTGEERGESTLQVWSSDEQKNNMLGPSMMFDFGHSYAGKWGSVIICMQLMPSLMMLASQTMYDTGGGTRRVLSKKKRPPVARQTSITWQATSNGTPPPRTVTVFLRT